MNSKEKLSLLQTVWNATFGKKEDAPNTEDKKEANTEMAADAPAADPKVDAPVDAPAPDMNAKLDEVLKAISALVAKVDEMDAAKAADAVAMSAIKDTVGGLIEANTMMSAEVAEMKNIPQGEIAGKKVEMKADEKNEDVSILGTPTNTLKNLMARLKERQAN